MALITSRSNPHLKMVRALRQRKARQETGLFIAEGIRHVGEAIEAGASIEAIYYASDRLASPYARMLVSQAIVRDIPCFELADDLFESIADKENPQGLLAVVRQPAQSLANLNPERFPWGVALVVPQDPGNLGAILRTVDAVGASGLILLDGGVDPFHPSAVRASMGTIFWYPVVSASLTDFEGWISHHAYHVYGTSAHAATDYRHLSAYERPCILLMGNEREGLTSEQAAMCEQTVALPMLGRATSLNLAIATGVMLYRMLEKM